MYMLGRVIITLLVSFIQTLPTTVRLYCSKITQKACKTIIVHVIFNTRLTKDEAEDNSDQVLCCKGILSLGNATDRHLASYSVCS